MANTIILKKSSTASAVPSAGSLQPGELAVNLADAKLYSKTVGGTVIQLGGGGGSGTVTSVGFTGGIISVATATTTPALTVAGTSGGIPYFSSGSTWATSGTLAANSIVIGGGVGVAPASTTTGTGVITALGVNTGTAGAFVVNGAALGTPTSGTVTNLTGTASININGTVGATTPSTGSFTTLSASSTVNFTGALTSGNLANAVGYKGLPENAQNVAYTLALSDMGKLITTTNGSSMTIPANSAVAFPIGSSIVIFNNLAATSTIAITTDTLRLSGTATTGTRTIAQYGLATLVKVAATVWVATGNVT